MRLTFWPASSLPTTKGAMVLRIPASDGQTVEQTLDKWKDGETYKGQVQFK